MADRDPLTGVFCIMPTAFREDGSFDEVKYRENVNKICDSGAQVIVNMGTTGEFNHIGREEYQRIVKVLVKEVNSRIPIVVGASGINLEEAIARTKYAEGNGVDAVMNVVPFYYPLTQDECVIYFEELAESCPGIKLIAYNNPLTTKLNISPQTFKRLSELPNFWGTKTVAVNLQEVRMCYHLAPKHNFYTVETTVTLTMQMGATGYFASCIWINPGVMMELYRLCCEKRWNEAAQIEIELTKFLSECFAYCTARGLNEITLTKALAKMSGFIDTGNVRKCYKPYTQEDVDFFRKLAEEKYRMFITE